MNRILFILGQLHSKERCCNYSLNERHRLSPCMFMMVIQARLQDIYEVCTVSVSAPGKVFFEDLAEMKPIDRESNGLRKKAGTAD